jgi:hypothetical protein
MCRSQNAERLKRHRATPQIGKAAELDAAGQATWMCGSADGLS